jgi:Ion channel
LLIVLVLNLIAAAMVLEFERGNPAATIDSYPDALWWAVTTITTVGYGDRFPMSSAGRAVAVVLMIAGIAMFGVITATIAAYFVEQKAEEDVASRLDQIMERLDRIEAGMRPGEDQHARYPDGATSKRANAPGRGSDRGRSCPPGRCQKKRLGAVRRYVAARAGGGGPRPPAAAAPPAVCPSGRRGPCWRLASPDR